MNSKARNAAVASVLKSGISPRHSAHLAQGLSCALIVLTVLGSVPAAGQFQTLVEFEGVSGANKGADPGRLILANDGNFYGTTHYGGASGDGTVFRMTPNGHLMTLLEFTGADGAVPGNNPEGGLVQGRDGNLYGTTESEQAATFATIYRLSLDGKYTLLDKIMRKPGGLTGTDMVSGLIQARDGNFYGTFCSGGATGMGSIFRVTPDGKLTILHEFVLVQSPNSMFAPYGRLFEASNGDLYGTTTHGGPAYTGGGSVYLVTPGGHVGFVGSLRGYTHNSTGGCPEDGLIQANDGNFYGGAPVFGRYGFGTIYRMTPQGIVTTLVNFTGFGPGLNGKSPIYAPVQGPDGALYGPTASEGPVTHFGTLYRVTLQGNLTTLVNFTGVKGAYPGRDPESSLLAMADGSFYGTTADGGAHDQGTIFRFKPTPEMLAAAPDQGVPPGAFATTPVAPENVAAVPTPATTTAPGADAGEHTPEVINSFKSPDGGYAVAMVNKPWLATNPQVTTNYHVLVLSKNGKEIAEYPTWREMLDAFWSPDGKYVAVDNLRSDMGGDRLWVLALPDGRVIKAPDDGTAKAWFREGLQAIKEHFPEIARAQGNGKGFNSILATGWQGDQLKFTVERDEEFDRLQGLFDFNALADPASFPAIAGHSFALHGTGSLAATNSRDLTMKEEILGWWASAHHAYRFKDDGICYAQGHGTGTTRWDFRDGVYYENDTPFDVVSLTDQQFVCRSRGTNPATLRLNRIGEADATKY